MSTCNEMGKLYLEAIELLAIASEKEIYVTPKYGEYLEKAGKILDELKKRNWIGDYQAEVVEDLIVRAEEGYPEDAGKAADLLAEIAIDKLQICGRKND